MEEYKQEIRIIAQQILQGCGGDFQKATEGVREINRVLVENPKIIPFISDKENIKEFKKLKMPKGNNPMDIMSLLGQLKGLSARFNKA